MNVLSLFRIKKLKKNRTSDFYQDAINKLGREQLQGLVERGLRIPIARV